LLFLLRNLIALSLPNKTIYANWGTWLGALVYACHPVAVYAVGYVIQRSILMATLFTLAMQLTYLYGVIDNQKLRQKFWLALSLIFYFLAVFSKEHSLMAPALILAITILLYPKFRADKRTLWLTGSGYLIIAVAVTLRAKGVFGAAYEFSASDLFDQQGIIETTPTLHLLSIFTQAGLFFKYLFLWFLPNPAWLSVDMREVFSRSVGDWVNWLKILAFITYGVLAWKLLWKRGRMGLLGFALLYPWLLFIVEFSAIRVQEPFVLYRSYLWVPGLMLLFPLIVAASPSPKKTITTITIIALSLIPLSWNRLWVFADGYRLWNDAALLLKNEHAPGAVRIYFNRGKLALDAKKWEAAIVDFARVERINPNIVQIYMHTGTAYSGLGKYQESINAFDRAIVLKPDYANAYYGKGLTLMHMHLNKEAMVNMKKSCDLKNSTACLLVAFSKSKGN
jgi:hypothetical protein